MVNRLCERVGNPNQDFSGIACVGEGWELTTDLNEVRPYPVATNLERQGWGKLLLGGRRAVIL